MLRVVEHHLWQEADDGLWMLDRVFQTSGTDLVTAFCEDWPATKAMVKNLADAAPEADWAKAILRYADRVDDELTRVEGESAANGQGMGIEVVKGGLYLRYSDFRHEARWHFFAVDQLLKSDCTAIVTIGAPLQSMLKDLGDA